MYRTLITVPSYIFVGIIVLLMVAVGVVGVLYINDHEALATIQDESAQLQAHVTQAELLLDDSQHRIADLNEQLDLHKQLLSVARTEANAASASVDKLNSAVASVSQTATYLTKLKETDEELLAKYSKVYFLNEHYVPRALTNIPPVYTAGKTIQFHAQAEPFLQRLLDAATSAGLHVQVASAYRSFEYQGQLKGQYTQTYGSGANTFSADQGYSEHQLGTALDPESDPRVKTVFDDIRATRQTDFINNLWRRLAFDPPLLEATWAEVKRVMATPSAIDPLTK
jgi:LAS superfamily LD-carboxypeptidase LdcB